AWKPFWGELHLIRRSVLFALTRDDVDLDQFRARITPFCQIGAGFVGLIEEDAFAVRRPGRASCYAAGLGDAPHTGSVGTDDVDAGGLEHFPLAGERAWCGLAVGTECDPGAVRRPCGPKVARLPRGEGGVLPGGEVEEPEICGTGATGGDEGEGSP